MSFSAIFSYLLIEDDTSASKGDVFRLEPQIDWRLSKTVTARFGYIYEKYENDILDATIGYSKNAFYVNLSAKF